MIYPGLVDELSQNDYTAEPPKPVAGRKYLILVPRLMKTATISLACACRISRSRAGPIRAGTCDGQGLAKGSCFCLAHIFRSRRRKRDPISLGDLRRSLEERYPTNEHYLKAIAQAAETLQKERLLLVEDVDRIVKADAARTDK